MRNIRFRDFFARCFICCFAGFALVVPAQSQAPGQNPDTNAPVAIPPDALAKPQPAVQPQPSSDRWADFFRIQKVSKDDDWTRHFRIGAMAGMNISANFSMKGPVPVTRPAGVYDDGYVRVDDTGNAQGYTSFWGYNQQSQLVGSTLTMHNTTSYSASGSSEESGVFPGFDMAYGGNLFYLGRARIGWDLGFDLLPINITDSQAIKGVSLNQTVYTFNTGTITVPGAPYQGPFYSAGNPTIFSNPTSTTNIPISGETITGSHTLDAMFYTMRLGPSVYWDLNEDFGLSASAGPAIGIVSGDCKYDEIITAGSPHNRGQFGATDLVYGGYVNTTLMYHVPGENADIYVGAQYMPMKDASFSGGGREAQLKLGGQVYISAGINWAF